MCNVTKIVIGYKTKQTQIQRFLPRIFHSCTGVLRFTIEIIDKAPWLDGQGCIRIELNTPVSHDDIRGWYNFVTWENSWVVPSEKRDTPIITTSHSDISMMKSAEGGIFTLWSEKGNVPFLNIEVERTGEMAGPPNEDDNEGTFYFSRKDDKEICYFKPVEDIPESRERCRATFSWDYSQLDNMPRKYSNLPMVCEMKCDRILGAYMVKFERDYERDNNLIQIIG